MSEVRTRQIAKNIESFGALTPTLPPATHTQSYALGEREVLLVEPATPYEEERREWLAWAEGIRSQGRDLVAIFATHHHPDHVGGAAFFAEALELPIWCHAATASKLPNLRVARTLAEGDSIILDGPSQMKWEVLHTPGHAPGHLCLLESSEGALIVGDMVASVGTILIEPSEGDMIDYLASLRRLDGLNARLALPAHGDAIPEPSARFRAYIAHRLMREGSVLRAVNEKPRSTLAELLPVAYADTPEYLFPIAKLSLEAHLIKLMRNGLVLLDEGLYRSA